VLSLGPTEFTGFQAEDFDAYEERKWSSNRFNLERMRARGNLDALAKAALPPSSLGEKTLTRDATHDHPTLFNNKQVDAQWVFFTRPETERATLASRIDRAHTLQTQIGDAATHHLHAILGFRLAFDGLTMLFGVHRNSALDVRNLIAKCEKDEEKNTLLEYVKALPEGTLFVGGPEPVEVHSMEAKALDGLASFEERSDQGWVQFALEIPRDDPRLQETGFQEEARTIMASLVPIYTFCAWSTDNDHLDLSRIMKEEKQARREAAGKIEIGCTVRLTEGVFAGRKGKLLEIDNKGMTRVLLGTLTVKADIEELQPL
jgi:transcription antitermination factor NusG